MNVRFFATLLFLLGWLAALPAAASDTTDVARISAIGKGGSVIVQRGDEESQLAATINAPVLPGDFVATQADTQAELQLDGFAMLRLGSNVQARLVNNDSTDRHVQLAQGDVILSVLHAESAVVQIDTPSVTLRVSEPGSYRLSVAADGSTVATARTGRAEILAGQQSYPLLPGASLKASGSAGNPTVATIAEVPSDALDAYSSARDRIANAALNTDTYAPQSIAGYDDLDSYGRWVDVEPYGEVWAPSVPAGWAPYRYGSWVWEDGFGWTWVAVEPWGWAPYHYGRWFYAAPYGWCWYPPAIALVPVWYPALVGFFGFGDYYGVGLGFAYWGWVPLAPFEPFYPWYPGWGGWHSHPHPPLGPPIPPGGHVPPVRVHPRYGQSVAESYRNLRYGGTGVTGPAFRAGNFTRTVAIKPQWLKNITVIRGSLPLTPTTANIVFDRSHPTAHVGLSPLFEQPRFRESAAVPRRTQFAQQQAELHQTLKAQEPRPVPAKPQVPPASDVWQRFESERRSAPAPLAPQPRQYPITTPIEPRAPQMPQMPQHPPAMPPMRPPSMPQMPPQRPPSRPPVGTTGAAGALEGSEGRSGNGIG
ncbi:MAG TPA: DUF6600 domain-containing protein [Verrucomicrobiae bacterium]|nr:DUF6600 domain-containing protein [Verrucomicrobiae bacterium]